MRERDEVAAIGAASEVESATAAAWTAIIAGEDAAARLALDRGASVRAVASDGTTLLGLAAATGNLDLVRDLLDRGAPVDGPSPAMPSDVRMVHETTEVARVSWGTWSARRAEPPIVEAEHPIETALAGAWAQHGAVAAISDGNLQVSRGGPSVVLLAARGASLAARTTRHPAQVVFHAAAVGDAPLDSVLHAGLDADASERDGTRALHLAAEHASADVVDRLLRRGAAARGLGPWGSALGRALRSLNHGRGEPLERAILAKLELLLCHGADPDETGAPAERPLLLALAPAKKGSFLPNVAARLASAGADTRGLPASARTWLAAALGDVAALEKALGKKPSSATCSQAAATAAATGQVEAVRRIGTEVAPGWALAEAAERGHLPVLELLFPRVADDRERQMALDRACAAGHVDAARWLVELGAPLDLPEASWASPLAIAAKAGHVACVRLLLRAGAEVSPAVVGNRPGSPLTQAVRRGDRELVGVLLGAGVARSMDSGYRDRMLLWAEEASQPEIRGDLVAAFAAE